MRPSMVFYEAEEAGDASQPSPAETLPMHPRQALSEIKRLFSPLPGHQSGAAKRPAGQ